MDPIQYIGETTWPFHLGHFSNVLAFFCCLFATLAYYFSLRSKSSSSGWRKLGRAGFIIHSVAIFVVIGLMFFVMGTQKYEYQYAWSHVSADLPMKYILSAFWEGQEGSFLLWMFWHIVLGLVIIYKRSSWEPSVMMILALIQLFINSMILGLYVPIGGQEFKIGSSPILLLRDVIDAPIFNNVNYLSMIEGQGLNPLLQNYWMTIHPPVLFLGFAACSIPFCYAISGLFLREHQNWLKPALRWSIFAAIVLGTGILMGAAWAYEALSFGGYWAWDPVENTSLVPWLVMLAGIHTNLVGLKTKYSIKSTYIFYSLSFILVLYSTFLTRSGILGDTSAHAFTEMGLENQLILFILFFVGLSIAALASRIKGIPTPKKEEHIMSREFWMFIGSIVLFFSAALITSSTSLPVVNSLIRWLVNPDYIGMVIEDPVNHYNKYQLWIAVFIGVISTWALYLRYKLPSSFGLNKKWVRHLAALAIISLLITLVISPGLTGSTWAVKLLLFAGIYSILANLGYMIFFVKGNLKLSASALSHLGFGMLILGVLISGLNQSFISTNPFAMRGLVSDNALAKNISLIKGSPFFANNYWITYEGDTIEGNQRMFDIKFEKVNKENTLLETFTVRPNAVYSNDFTKISAWNPDTKHYLHKDIFTVINGYPAHLTDIERAKELEDTLQFTIFQKGLRDTIRLNDVVVELSSINYDPRHPDFQHSEFDLTMGLNLTIESEMLDSTIHITPALALKDGLIYQFPITVDALGMRFKLDEVFFTNVFTQEQNLNYHTIQIKEGEMVDWGGYSVKLTGFDREPSHKNYIWEEGDIALSGILDFYRNDQLEFQLSPIYIIRQQKQFGIKDYHPEEGVHARFAKIYPSTSVMEFMLGTDSREYSQVPLLVAQDVPRSDILVLEARIFPGINLVWAGSIFMMLGLGIAWYNKLLEKNTA